MTTGVSTSRRPKPDCVSDLTLDALAAGELSDAESRACAAHLETCSTCSARRAALDADRARRGASLPALSTLLAGQRGNGVTPIARARRRRPILAWSGPAFGLALAAAALVFWVRPASDDDRGGVRTKGADTFGFYVKRGAEVWRGAEGEVVRRGDALQFTFTLAEPRYVAVLALDGAKKASAYWPADGRMRLLGAGTDVLGNESAVLDGSSGQERLVGLFCASPVDVAPILGRLATVGSVDPLPPACQADVITLDKQP